MPPRSGLAQAAAICVVAAPLCAIVLVRASRDRDVWVRRAMRTMAVAASVAPLAVAAAAVDVFLTGYPDEGDRVRLTAELAAGFTVTTLLVVAGLLMLPGVALTLRARLRHVLDGLVMAASVFYVGWTLAIEPLHRHYVGGPVPLVLEADCMVVAAPSVGMMLALGVFTAVGLKAQPPRQAIRRACAAAGVACVAGLAVVAAVYAGNWSVTPVAMAAYGFGLVGLAWVISSLPVSAEPVPDRPNDGAGVAFALVGLAVVACALRLVFDDAAVDEVSVATVAMIGGALAAQQALARSELRRTTDHLARSEAHFRSMAYTDPLTGLSNRRQLLKTLQEDVVDGPTCVLLAIDLDGFKNINDIRGHDVGDAVLIEVARRLRSNVRPGDLPVRMGGDEFAVLMWAHPLEARTASDRLLALLSRPYELSTGTVFMSASIGMAGCHTADDIDSLLRNADVALRFAKQRGKHRVEHYDLAYDQWLRRRTDLEHELRGAVQRGELMVMYQPIVRLPDGRVAGVEALLRWHHPRLGAVPPDEFIPLAEEAGMISGLGAFVLHEACHQLSRWLADGHEIYLAVNVSVRELHTPEYAAQVAELLRGHHVPAERLVVEVTEHAVAQDLQQLVERLETLRSSGIRIALDDFGSGYSSLGQLRTLPVDILKIDRALIEPPDSTAVRFAPPLADVVVRLGNRLGLDVVAEGISGSAQRRVLEDAGCRYAQGELFGRAMPAERVEALFTTLVDARLVDDAGDAGTEALDRVTGRDRPAKPAPQSGGIDAGPAVGDGRPAAPRPRGEATPWVQNVGSVDSGHEMRQS